MWLWSERPWSKRHVARTASFMGFCSWNGVVKTATIGLLWSKWTVAKTAFMGCVAEMAVVKMAQPMWSDWPVVKTAYHQFCL